MESYNFLVENEESNLRIDIFLSNKIKDVSRSYIQKLIENGLVKINGKSVNKNFKISKGMNISVTFPEIKELEVKAENIPLDIVYEDKDLIIVNKPKDMVVHPAPGNYDRTLVNALLYHCKDSLSGINGVLRPGIVHRIDKDTSGLLIVAKNDISHKIIAEQIKNHSFKREYEAVVIGNLNHSSGCVKTYINRHKLDRKKMAVSKTSGKLAITNYQTIENYKGYSHIKLILETGRTHQIRVHMSYLGHAVLGDEVYGKNKKTDFPFLKGQCLHAKTIGFIHPTSNKYIEFTSQLPEYFKKTLDVLKTKI